MLLPAAQKMGLPVIALPIGAKRLSALMALRRWLALHGRGFDVINMHSSTDSWLSALACRTLRGMPPLVRTRHVSTAIHNTLPTRWLYLRATAHIVTAGEALRQQLHRDNRFPLEHMTSVPPASISRVSGRANRSLRAGNSEHPTRRHWALSPPCVTGKDTRICSRPSTSYARVFRRCNCLSSATARSGRKSSTRYGVSVLTTVSGLSATRTTSTGG
jgi:hypothetical protein